MNATASYERVQDHLRKLSLETALVNLDELLERAQKEQKLPVEVLDELLERELVSRFERRVKTNLRLSGLPHTQRLETFDYEAGASVPRDVIRELATLRFLHNGENVLFLGPCGVGKTRLAVGLCLRAIEEGFRVYFLTLHDLVTRSRAARARDRLHVLMSSILRVDLFVLDELGFIPLEPEDATFLFEIINKRYQNAKSTIVTSNKSFAQWGEIFPDTTLAVALLDRLLHHATTINIRGESYRLRHRREAGLVDTSVITKEQSRE